MEYLLRVGFRQYRMVRISGDHLATVKLGQVQQDLYRTEDGEYIVHLQEQMDDTVRCWIVRVTEDDLAWGGTYHRLGALAGIRPVITLQEYFAPRL